MSGNPLMLNRVDTHVSHTGFSVPDPFAPRRRPGASVIHALMATALFRCWHILVFYGAWSTLIAVLNHQGHGLSMQPTLLTVVGTVIGFVISYRTTSSFERYNEGRKLWSLMIFACRTFGRTTWFHVPDYSAIAVTDGANADEVKGRSMIEKKTVINLLEAYAVSIKHYLRGEDGIYYEDLYHLVKFLPAYALPAGMPSSATDAYSPHQPDITMKPDSPRNGFTSPPGNSFISQRSPSSLPLPVTSPSHPYRPPNLKGHSSDKILSKDDEAHLLPSQMPPKYHFLDLFPFSLLVGCLTERGRTVKGKTAAKLRARMRQNAVSHNLPLEISLYLSSYVATLQNRKVLDVPTANTLLSSLNQLVEVLTGLERILTTPIPFSYSIHLWAVTHFYCLFMPFQLWGVFGWLTIPATVVLSFMFFGFLVAGEEIENPFGYDKNDLNLDHFTNNVIRNELRAITSAPPPDPSRWAFATENNLLFNNNTDGERIPPAEWLKRGHVAMLQCMSTF